MKISLSGRKGLTGRSGLIGLICLSGLLVLLLAGCGVDPRKDAIAEKTRIEANTAALDAEQARAIEKQEADQKAAQAAWWRAVWDSALETGKAVMKVAVRFIGYSFAMSVSVALMGFCFVMLRTSHGIGLAAVAKAETLAGLIHMDKNTRTYPAFRDVKQIHGTKFIAMLETGGVMRLDAAKDADRQMIAAWAQTAAIGAAFQEMKNAPDAAGMSVFQPDVITAKQDGLLVGAQ